MAIVQTRAWAVPVAAAPSPFQNMLGHDLNNTCLTCYSNASQLFPKICLQQLLDMEWTAPMFFTTFCNARDDE